MAGIKMPGTSYGPATATAIANTTEGEKKTINQELWQACAGPLVNLPAAGTHVVYFPQGHSEQVAASMKKNVDGEIPNYPNLPNLPSKLTCLLHNVTLHADPETDEVYAQMTLQPVPSFDKEALLRSDISMKTNRPQTEFFCKTLTASDTSTHGGFSVPRRAAEKIFHPLDFTLQPPAQELETRDLHDNVWRFRHIFRGQPKRHLLTTGWSLFVSGKRLFAGDSVLFIRDEKQHLLLGIRRANRQPTNLSSSVLSSDSMHIGILAAAAHASANNSPFTVFYNPRASLSEFVIPLAKYYRAACSNQISLGMRFRMMFETEESGTRRYMGTITGITDLDPVRWKNSQWRNLQVGWDESIAGEKRNRVSIWEIEPVTAPFFICPTPFFRPKRPRQPGMPDDDSSDLENVFKRTTIPWFDDDLGMMKDSHLNPGFSLMQWMNMQHNPSPANSMQPSYLNSLSGPVLQNFGGGGGVAAQFGLQSNIPQQNNLQFNKNTTQIQKPLQQTHIDLIQKLPADPALNPLGSMINHVPAQMLQSQCQSLVQNNIILQPQPPSTSNHQLQINLSSNIQPQQNLDPLSQQLQMSDNQIQFQLLQKLQQQQQVLLAQQQSSVQQQSQLPQFHDHQSKMVEIPQSSSHSVPQQPMPKRDNSQQIVRFSNPPPQQQKRIPGPLTDNEIPGHLSTNNYFSSVGNSLLTGVGGGQSVITDDVPSCSTSPSTNNCPNNRTQQQTTQFSATLFGSTGWESVSANNSSIKDMKQNPDITSSTNILKTSLNQEFLAPSTYTNAGGGHIDYLDTSSATSVCLSQNDLNLQQNNTTMAYNNTQIMLLRDTSQDEEALAVGFETNIETQMGMPMIPDHLLAKPTVGGSSKDFFNNLSNYDEAKDLQQELSSKIVSQSFGVPDMSFNSLDSSINDSSFLNSWVPPPQLQRMRTYTKVYKRGAVGRSIDIGRYSDYEELKQDLARRFGIEGQLEDRHRVGWKLVYVDHENDVLLVGDDPWEEFVNCVRCIKILSPQEVQQMSLDVDFGNNVLPNPAGSSSDGGNV